MNVRRCVPLALALLALLPAAASAKTRCASSASRASTLARHAGEVRPRRILEVGPARRAQHPRAEPRHVGQRGVLRAAGQDDRVAREGLAGVVGRAAREPARGPVDAQPRQGADGDGPAGLRLLPRVPRRQERQDALQVHPGRRGRLRQAVGHGHRDRATCGGSCGWPRSAGAASCSAGTRWAARSPPRTPRGTSAASRARAGSRASC